MKKISITTKIFIGLALGVIVGVILGQLGLQEFANSYIQPFGSIFLNLIKMIIVPLVFSSLVVGIAGLGDPKKLGRIGLKSFAFFFCTSIVALVLALSVSNLVHLGSNVDLSYTMASVADNAVEAPRFMDTLVSFFPSNPIKAMVEADMLQIITFSVFFGLALMLAGEKGKPVFNVLESLAEIMYKLTNIVMEFAPYGVFALVANIMSSNGTEVLAGLAAVVLVAYFVSALHSVIVYPFLVKAFANISPKRFFKALSPVMTLAFSTCSSSGTLPATTRATKDDIGVSNGVTSFVLPLGATMHMDGTAIYQAVCATFIANACGVDLTLAQQLTIVLTAVFASVGTAGVPGSGFIMLTMVLNSVGLPIEAASLIAGIDRVLDMARTTVNVLGDSAVAIAIAGTEGEQLNS